MMYIGNHISHYALNKMGQTQRQQVPIHVSHRKITQNEASKFNYNSQEDPLVTRSGRPRQY